MTKADIVNEISKNTGIEKVTVQKAVESFMESVSASLAEGSNVYLRGFGSFIVKKRAEKPHVTFHATLLLSFQNTTFLHSNRQKPSSIA